MNVLVIGSGGREHALAWKCSQSSRVERVLVAPGNAGTAAEKKIENLPIDPSDIDRLVDLALKEKVGLTIVGPEDPLVSGITDAFQEAGLRCFGPTLQGAKLEGSKAFAKDFLAKHHISTARYRVCNDMEAASAFIRDQGPPIVVKADGLAAGKGVIICHSVEEALSASQDMLAGHLFGDAGRRVVIEECLEGEEASFIVMVDGRHILPLATSQDHKARDNGDTGPNTGGMGAYSPAPVVTEELYHRIMQEVIEPTVEGMVLEGHPYTGFLYAGLMIGSEGTPHVLEYNCRLGDPETQPILLRLRSDLVELCLVALEGRLDQVTTKWDERVALGVVMASGGYPISYDKGAVISGLPEKEEEGVKVFHAGTKVDEGRTVTNGGRVLCATALGKTVRQAQARAYAAARQITWKDVYYRTDIGHRAIAREKSNP